MVRGRRIHSEKAASWAKDHHWRRKERSKMDPTIMIPHHNVFILDQDSDS